MKRFVSTSFLVAIFTLSLLASGLTRSAWSADITPQLDVKHEGNITYISGGVGDEEETAIRALGQDFNLKLTLADKNSAWLANVDVQIEDMKGNSLFDQKVEGPLVYMKLPNGKYTVTARSAAGDTHTNTVWIDNVRQATSYFYLGRDKGQTEQAKVKE
jgi:hypothetical protein